MSSKKDLFQAVLDGKANERVPVGFWFHFFKDELIDAQGNTALIQDNINGHRQFIETFSPDFVKLMSDGYFIYPNSIISLEANAADLKQIKSIGKNHPWIEEQVALVKRQREQFSEDIFSFYNIFAPATYLKFALGGDDKFVEFVTQFDEVVIKHVLDVISKDIAVLAQRIITEALADGIYYSTQNIQTSKDSALFEKFVKPSDLIVQNAAEAVDGVNILHICGYEGAKNNLTDFKDYPAKIVNWATAIEGVSLSEGNQIFPDKVLLGGFGNTINDVIYKGNETEIKQKTQEIINSINNKTKILIGADCTVPRDIPLENLNWVREAAVINQ